MDFVQTEDAIEVLLDYFVSPLLPLRESSDDPPTERQQIMIAKQMHAVVVLYNYYHRKQFPLLNFLSFEPFCKISCISKPGLLPYLRYMHKCEEDSENSSNQLSITEKKVMDACNICIGLDASKQKPTMKEWPISKIAIFLVDSKKENCVLQFCCITQGVWSLVEKELACYGDKLVQTESYISEKVLEQLAFSTVEKETGISLANLDILERHLTYCLSHEKTTTRLYIMKYEGTLRDEITEVSIEDVKTSLGGPIVQKELTCEVTPVVEYYHMLPYYDAISSWVSRESTGQQVNAAEKFSLDSTKDHKVRIKYVSIQSRDDIQKNKPSKSETVIETNEKDLNSKSESSVVGRRLENRVASSYIEPDKLSATKDQLMDDILLQKEQDNYLLSNNNNKLKDDVTCNESSRADAKLENIVDRAVEDQLMNVKYLQQEREKNTLTNKENKLKDDIAYNESSGVDAELENRACSSFIEPHNSTDKDQLLDAILDKEQDKNILINKDRKLKEDITYHEFSGADMEVENRTDISCIKPDKLSTEKDQLMNDVFLQQEQDKDILTNNNHKLEDGSTYYESSGADTVLENRANISCIEPDKLSSEKDQLMNDAYLQQEQDKDKLNNKKHKMKDGITCCDSSRTDMEVENRTDIEPDKLNTEKDKLMNNTFLQQEQDKDIVIDNSRKLKDESKYYESSGADMERENKADISCIELDKLSAKNDQLMSDASLQQEHDRNIPPNKNNKLKDDSTYYEPSGAGTELVNNSSCSEPDKLSAEKDQLMIDAFLQQEHYKNIPPNRQNKLKDDFTNYESSGADTKQKNRADISCIEPDKLSTKEDQLMNDAFLQQEHDKNILLNEKDKLKEDFTYYESSGTDMELENTVDDSCIEPERLGAKKDQLMFDRSLYKEQDSKLVNILTSRRIRYKDSITYNRRVSGSSGATSHSKFVDSKHLLVPCTKLTLKEHGISARSGSDDVNLNSKSDVMVTTINELPSKSMPSCTTNSCKLVESKLPSISETMPSVEDHDRSFGLNEQSLNAESSITNRVERDTVENNLDALPLNNGSSSATNSYMLVDSNHISTTENHEINKTSCSNELRTSENVKKNIDEFPSDNMSSYAANSLRLVESKHPSMSETMPNKEDLVGNITCDLNEQIMNTNSSLMNGIESNTVENNGPSCSTKPCMLVDSNHNSTDENHGINETSCVNEFKTSENITKNINELLSKNVTSCATNSFKLVESMHPSISETMPIKEDHGGCVSVGLDEQSLNTKASIMNGIEKAIENNTDELPLNNGSSCATNSCLLVDSNLHSIDENYGINKISDLNEQNFNNKRNLMVQTNGINTEKNLMHPSSNVVSSCAVDGLRDVSDVSHVDTNDLFTKDHATNDETLLRGQKNIQQPQHHEENIVSDSHLSKGNNRVHHVQHVSVSGFTNQKASMVNSVMSITNRAAEDKTSYNGASQDNSALGNMPHVSVQLNSNDHSTFYHVLASKKNDLLQASLRVLQKKMAELCQQKRFLEDEIACCEMNIQKILTEGEKSGTMVVESIIGALNSHCTSQPQIGMTSSFEEKSPFQTIKRRKLSEAVLTSRNSCQELDDICHRNSWILPRYTVQTSSADHDCIGMFKASVKIHGTDFEFSGDGDQTSSPCEARESAASRMLTKLRMWQAGNSN